MQGNALNNTRILVRSCHTSAPSLPSSTSEDLQGAVLTLSFRALCLREPRVGPVEDPQAPEPENPVQRSAAQTEQRGRTGVRLNKSRIEAACPAGCPSEQLRKYSDGWIWVRAGTEHFCLHSYNLHPYAIIK